MIDIKFLKENPEVVKQNIRNKFQDRKLPLVDEVIELDRESRAVQTEANAVRATRNKLSKQIGALMGQGKREEAEAVKAQVQEATANLDALEAREAELAEEIKKRMTRESTSSIQNSTMSDVLSTDSIGFFALCFDDSFISSPMIDYIHYII